MPYTTVVAGTAITASWSNANNRDQTIVPFLTAVARDAAITSPVIGQVAYLKTNAIDEGLTSYTSAAAWRPPWNLPWGFIVESTSTSAAGGIGAAVDLLTVTWTAVANRKYLIDASASWLTTAVATNADLLITDNANTQIAKAPWSDPAAAAAANMGPVCWTVVSPAAGSVTYKSRVAAGGGTITLLGAANQPHRLLVTDIGPNGQPA